MSTYKSDFQLRCVPGSLGRSTREVLAGVPLGTVASGYLAAWIGFQMTLLIMGALYLVTTLSLLVNPATRTMEKRLARRRIKNMRLHLRVRKCFQLKAKQPSVILKSTHKSCSRG